MRGKRPGLHGGIRHADGTTTPPPAADGFDTGEEYTMTVNKKDPPANPAPPPERVNPAPGALAPTTGAAAQVVVPKGLEAQFTAEEWAALSAEDRNEALAFFREEQAETTEGLQVTFPRIKYPTSGSSFFEIPTAAEAADVAKTIEGVVVFKQPVRAWWPSLDITNTPPDCSSLDGIRPVDGPRKQAEVCASCEHAQFGTGKDGFGQACKQRLNVFMLIGDDELPTLLSLPPTALKAFAAYAVQLRKMNSALLAKTTVFGLIDQRSQGGKDYKGLKLVVGRDLTFVEMKKARAIREAFEMQMAKRGIQSDEAAATDAEPAAASGEPF